jgi:adenosylhomocysteine nucleosidase
MIGIVTGLTAEARMVRHLGRVRAGGGKPEGAALAARRLVADGATALISFGLAGGLNPGLSPGTLIIPASVVTARATYPTCTSLTQSLGGPAHTMWADTEIVVSAAEKARLHAHTGADAIDLESGAVAEVAAEHGLPFAVLRVICDPASTTLPPAALIALNAQGAISLRQVIAPLLRNPRQLADLLRLARDAASARRTLQRHLTRIQLPLSRSV